VIRVKRASSSSGGGTAVGTTTNTTNFGNILSSSDTTVQAALDTIDNSTYDSIVIIDNAVSGNTTKESDGNWRFKISNGDLLIEKREGGTWNEKSAFIASDNLLD